jgi:hypothetical protein
MSQHSVNDPGYAAISNVTTSTQLVAAPGAGFCVVVIGYKLQLDALGEYTLFSAATAITGTMELAADTPDGAFCTSGILRCAENEALNLTATTAANGFVRYVIARA